MSFGNLQAPKIECSFLTFLSWLDFWKRLFTFGSLYLVQFSLQGKFNLDLSFTFLAFLHDWITNESVFVVFLILICFTGCQVYVCFVQWNTLYIISLGCIELSNTFFKVDWRGGSLVIVSKFTWIECERKITIHYLCERKIFAYHFSKIFMI